MANDTVKLRAEIAHLEAETNKFQQEADESRWRRRPIWFYGKWFIASCVAGLTFAFGFFSVLKPYWDYQEKLVAGEQIIAARAREEAKEELKNLKKSLTVSFARSQAQLKAQQADFKKREALLVKRINTLKAKLRRGAGMSLGLRGGTNEQIREIDRILEAFKKQPAPAFKSVVLRSMPKTISYKEILATISKNDFSLAAEKFEGNFRHDYKLKGDSIVIDRATGLMWERGGSSRTITFDKANVYVNALKLGDYSDWRLPTIEELLSLLEPRQKNGALYIDEKFNDRQRWIISADDNGKGRGWGLVFYEGKLYLPTRNFPYFVRAVRTLK